MMLAGEELIGAVFLRKALMPRQGVSSYKSDHTSGKQQVHCHLWLTV